MGKSDVKRLLDEMCPEVFTEAGEEDVVFPVIVEDSVVALRKWGHSIGRKHATQVSIDELVEYIFREALLFLKRSKCYIALFDKARCVTLAKEPEQTKRDGEPEQVPKVLGGHQGLLRFSALEWGRVINDRTSRNQLIRAIGHRAAEILPAKMHAVGVPEDHFIVIDFEGFDVEATLLPLIVRPSGAGAVPPDEHTTSTFRNELGEYDVAALHYLYHPAVARIIAETDVEDGQTAAILLRSIDTDMLPITLLNLNHNQPVRVESTLTKPTRNVFFNPVKLAEWISSLAGADASDAVEEFVRMYVIAGSDFVQSCPGLSNYTAMKTYTVGMLQETNRSPESILEAALTAGRVNVSGSKRASATASKCKLYDLKNCSARSHWCVNYWKHSVYAPEMLFASPLGRGFSLRGTQLVYTEDICTSEIARKKTKR